MLVFKVSGARDVEGHSNERAIRPGEFISWDCTASLREEHGHLSCLWCVQHRHGTAKQAADTVAVLEEQLKEVRETHGKEKRREPGVRKLEANIVKANKALEVAKAVLTHDQKCCSGCYCRRKAAPAPKRQSTNAPKHQNTDA